MDFNKVIQGLSKNGAVSGFAGGLAGSALVGAVSGKKGKKVAKNAMKVGALAAVGGLAYTAYQRYSQQSKQASSAAISPSAGIAPATPEPFANLSQQEFEAVVASEESPGALLLVRAMISAAVSDGHMDSDEQNRIFSETEKLSLSREEKATLFDELRNPLSMQQLVAQVNQPEAAVEVYAASLIAVDETRTEAQMYLRSLAGALELPHELVASIHQQVDAAKQQDVAA